MNDHRDIQDAVSVNQERLHQNERGEFQSNVYRRGHQFEEGLVKQKIRKGHK